MRGTVSAPIAEPKSDVSSQQRKPPAGLVLLLGLLTAIGPLSIDMYLPGLPEIARTLHADAGSAARTVAIFFFGMAIGQLAYGPLSDRKGRRAPLLGGLVLFLIGTIGCALAPSIDVLMVARLVQAIGACSGLVIARAIVRDHCGPRDSARIFSRLILVMGASPIFAPTLGGIVLLFGTWRTVFWLLFGAGALILIAVVFLLAESRSESTAAQAASENVLASYRAVLGMRDVIGFVLTGAFTSGVLTTYIATSPAVVIGIYHTPVEAFGWLFGLNGFGFIAASQINAHFIHRHRPVSILRWANGSLLLIAIVLLADVVVGLRSVWGILALLFLLMSSLGFNMPNTTAEAMALDPKRAGTTSALLGAVQFTVGATAATVATLFDNGTALPMAAVIAGAALTATVVLHTMVHAQSR